MNLEIWRHGCDVQSGPLPADEPFTAGPRVSPPRGREKKMNRLQQVPAPALVSALLWAAALATALLAAQAQATVIGAFAVVETSTVLDVDEDTDESATVADAATSSSDPGSVTAAGESTATYPDAAGAGGSAGAESTLSIIDPLGGGAGSAFSNGLLFGEFIAAGGGMVDVTLDVFGDLILDDSNATTAAFDVLISGVGVTLTLGDPADPGLETELFFATVEISRFFAAATTVFATGDWEDPLFPGTGIPAPGVLTVDPTCALLGETHTCTVGVDTTATISMLVADGEAFTLLLDLGTNVLGSGGLALDASALFLGSAAVSFASDTVTINPVPAQVEVDEPASLALLLAGLAIAGCARRHRRRRREIGKMNGGIAIEPEG